jgi:hypothetical protein
MFAQQDINRGWESNHQRLKKSQLSDDDRWRLRDWDSHPNDPGWEEGTYSSCHAEFRAKVRDGDIVFDTVYPGHPARTDPIIRSAFIIKGASDNVLSFDEFVFLDGNARNGVQARIPRGHKSLTREEIEGYLTQIEARDAYNRYSTGTRPESIPGDLWERMLKSVGTDSTCPSCSNREPCDKMDGDGGCD